MHGKKSTYIGIAIFLFAFLFLESLEFVMRPYAKEGIYFQSWSSETLMQTVSIKDLHDEPLKTLWNIHIQPPALDFIRTVFVNIWPAPNLLESLHHVDGLLYLLWALLYGLLGFLIFIWVFKLTNLKYALVSSVVFLLHPASILYATFLDSTFLSALLILVMYYLLWKVKNKYDVSPYTLAIVVLALFFTRSIFQWPFIFLFGVSLLLIRASKRTILLFLLISGSISGLYIAKQYTQFGITSTSSFTGVNLTNSVGMQKLLDYSTLLDSDVNVITGKNDLANVLVREKKIDGAINFNQARFLKLNAQLLSAYKNYIEISPLKRLVSSYLQNLAIYFMPSSIYSRNVIVQRIPWKSFYDRIFSNGVLKSLILFAGISWFVRVVKRKDYLESTGMVLPGLYIFLVCVLFEKGENMRFKFFLEPVIFVFIVSEIYHTILTIRERMLKKSWKDQETKFTITPSK